YKTDVFGANIVSNTYDAEKACWVIKFDGDVTEIGEDAFFNCDSITSVTIPDSVKTIGEVAFAECNSLTSVTIPNSVATIGENAFGWCDSLEKFSGKFASEDGRCLIIDGALNSFAPAGVTEYTIPDSVTKINDYVFSELSNLTKVVIGVNVTTIGKHAFDKCSNLTEVIIPNSVKSIGEYAFSECNSLTSVNIPDSVTTIEESAFRNSQNLKSVTIGNGLQTIEFSVFCGCSNLTSVTIGEGVTSIGEQAFCECTSLTSITIPDSVESIGWCAFAECSSLANVTIPNCVTEIGDWAFYLCSSLTNINIPDSVTTIGEGAFCDCSSLAGVTIGNGVTNIESWAFDYCSSLTSVYCKATATPNAILDFDGYWNAFDNNASGRKIYVPAASVEAYKSAIYWSDYAADIVGYDFENGVVVEVLPYEWYTESTNGIYEIDSAAEFFAFAKLCNGDAEALTAVGASEALTFEGKTINITANINLSSYCNAEVGSWAPISKFSGTLNGNNHAISNLYYNETGVTTSVRVGLFNFVANAVIRDITVDGAININSKSNFYIGGLAATSSNTLFENCTSSVDITSKNDDMGCYIGGICGSDSSQSNAYSTFIACKSDAYIKNEQDEWEWYNYIGGILGSGNYAKIIACVKQGGCVYEERTQSYTPVGGICGFARYSEDFRIIACYSNTEIDGRMPGHIVGACSTRGYTSPNEGSTKKIKECYYAGTSKVYNGDKGVGSDNYGGSTYSRDDGTARISNISENITAMNNAIIEWNNTATHKCDYRYTLDSSDNIILVHEDNL
ncbi:MAG: leucine-rich repeat domain-containing protein, partial [Alistipes sp.]|nr:leucine-rich repeat domain-containing protein [Alistipes sp.]